MLLPFLMPVAFHFHDGGLHFFLGTGIAVSVSVETSAVSSQTAFLQLSAALHEVSGLIRHVAMTFQVAESLNHAAFRASDHHDLA